MATENLYSQRNLGHSVDIGIERESWLSDIVDNPLSRQINWQDQVKHMYQILSEIEKGISSEIKTYIMYISNEIEKIIVKWNKT